MTPLKSQPSDSAPSSWTQGLADFLADERGVEAILVNPEQRKVSLATLGNVDSELLKAKLDSVLRALEAQFGNHPAGPAQASAFQLQVRQLPGADVLIEKPSCPTARQCGETSALIHARW